MWANERTYDAAVFAAAQRERPAGWSVQAFAALIKAHMARESAFDPKARNVEGSANDPRDDSRGLMQMRMATAGDVGYMGSTGNDTSRTGGLYDPTTSIDLGAALIKKNLTYARQYLDAAISAYNAGFGNPPSPLGRRKANGAFVNPDYVTGVKANFAYFLAQHGANAPLGTDVTPTATVAKTKGCAVLVYLTGALLAAKLLVACAGVAR
jgi:soluble lytic murein transglycosylase-like protein